jgi:hypothetical protein
MKITLALSLILLWLIAPAALGQTVVITPRKTVYTRPKPIQSFKRTFTIRRPIAKAATPVLSRKITAAIDPIRVLDIDLKGEIGEYQWLEEADYKVLYNRNGILSISEWMEGTAAYPDGVTKYVNIDLAAGRRLATADIFQDLRSLAAMIKKKQAAEVKASIEQMKKDPENSDVDPGQLFAEIDFKSEDIKEFSVSEKGITFYYDYGFPHAIEALQPTGEFFFTWLQLKPYIRRDGLLARFLR